MVRIQMVTDRCNWQVLLIPVSGFPVPPHERGHALSVLNKLSQRVAQSALLKREVLIQMAQLTFPSGSSQVFSQHAREWIPAMGLGVWPDRDPPTIWTAKDFENLVPGQAPRTLIDQVFRITNSENAKTSARDTLFGYGAVVEVLTGDSGEQFLDRCRGVLLPPISDPTYTCFPFYAPLLEAKSFANAEAADLGRWTCGVSAYFRESVQDNGVLIAANLPLIPILENIGARSARSDKSEWILDTGK